MWTFNGQQSSLRLSKQARAEKKCLNAFRPAYEVLTHKIIASPLILASPHSGRLYPKAFLNSTSVAIARLRLSEDSFVDEIIKPLAQNHIPVLHALFPRCIVDVNRGPNEWPPETILQNKAEVRTPLQHSPRAHAGLGVVPTRIANNIPIYSQVLSPKIIQERLDALYHPYHNALGQLINTTKSQFGKALLLDFHSMPGRQLSGAKRADFILGDRFGKTCAPESINVLQELLSSFGYSVTRNIPYAGGFITGHYGRVDQQVEAIQIEINKDLYLNPNSLTPHSGMPKLMDDMKQIIMNFGVAINIPKPIAAQ